MDKETYKQLDRIEGLLIEIAYELRILDEEGNYIKREERDEEETDDGIPLPPKKEQIKTSVKNSKSSFEDEENED